MNNPATAKSIPGQNVPKGRSSPAKGSKDRNSQRNLRKLRLLVGATQLQVAEKAGVTERCLRKVEQGKVRAQRGTLAAIEGAIAILGRTAQAAALLLLVLCSSGCNMAHAATGLQLVSVSCMAVLVAMNYVAAKKSEWINDCPSTTTNSTQAEFNLAQAWFARDCQAYDLKRQWRDEWQRRVTEPKYQTTRLAVWWHALRCQGPVRSYRMRWTGIAAAQRRPRPLYAECQHCSWPAQPCDTAKQEPPAPPLVSHVDSAAPVADSARNSYGLRWDGLQRSKGDA